MPPPADKQMIELLSRSKIYHDYERAFNLVTGLPLNLRPPEVWHLVHHSTKNENPFCAILSHHSRSCAACLEAQQKIAESTGTKPRSVRCFAGLSNTAVPVNAGGKLIGYLQTGQVFLRKPTQRQFARTTKQLLEWGLKVDLKQLEEAYFHTRVLTEKQYNSIISLLTIFGQHLSFVCHQVLVQPRASEPAAITRARKIIQEHHTDNLSLTEVAKAVNTSTYYFCKLFKSTTGLNFTEYLSQVRVEKAKNLMPNPNLRISEIAYQVGFQSLTHFNRVFKRITGQSPTDYRTKLSYYKNPRDGISGRIDFHSRPAITGGTPGFQRFIPITVTASPPAP
jgi:AraC-like DNA-binding protein